MSRLTGSEAKSLMEAYNAVYAPHEEVSVDLTEEDLEGIELIEMTVEEFDEFLSEQGGRNSPGARRAEAARTQRVAQQQQVKTALGQGKGLKLQGATPGSGSAGTGYGTQLGGRQGVVVKGAAAGSTGSGRSQRSNFQSAPGTVNVGGQTLYKARKGSDIVYLQGQGKPQLFKPGQTTPAAAPRQQPPAAAPRQQPPAAAPRQQPPAAAPATTSAKTVPAPGGVTKPEVPSAAPAPKTGNPLMKDNSISDMIKASQMRQRGVNVTSDNIASVRQSVQQANRPEVLNRPAPAGSALARQQQAQGSTVSGSGASGSAANPQVRAQLGMKPINPAPASAPRPVPVAAPTAKITPTPQKKKQPPIDPKTGTGAPRGEDIFAGVDLFDIVKGHLMSEGYADTEEAALAIMANMSEEWKQSIVEGGINFSVPSRIDDFNNRNDELKNRYKQDVGPRIPGPGGGGQYGEPAAPKAVGVRLARGTSSSKRGVESKNNA